MIHLWNTLLGYIQINYWRIPWILLFACALIAVFEVLQRIGCLKFKGERRKSILLEIALALTFSFVFVLTIFNRSQGNREFSLIPFASYRTALVENDAEILLQNIMNIATYIPFGFLLPCCFRYLEKARRVLAAIIICSVCIELIQGIAQIGYLEIDDILNNTFGAIIGLLLYRLFVKIKSKS